MADRKSDARYWRDQYLIVAESVDGQMVIGDDIIARLQYLYWRALASSLRRKQFALVDSDYVTGENQYALDWFGVDDLNDFLEMEENAFDWLFPVDAD